MNGDILNVTKPPARSKSCVWGIVIGVFSVTGMIVLCCCFPWAYGVYVGNTPEGQARATIRAEEQQSTRIEQTLVARIEATEEVRRTSTPVPTDTIVPTSTPVPTNTTEATNTPASTNTDVPANTPTVVSTTAPTETAIPIGLGVSRDDIQSTYSNPEVGFTFEESSEVDGQPRIMGTSPNGIAILELIGPPDDLLQVSIIIGIPDDDNTALIENVIYMLGLLNVVTPDWSGGSDWLTENMEIAIEEGEVSTTYGNAVITLQVIPEIGFMLLTIEAEGWDS